VSQKHSPHSSRRSTSSSSARAAWIEPSPPLAASPGAEWSALLRQLLSFSAAQRVRVTAVSGEIHLGALGVIERGATRIHQLTSSGVVHPAPPAWGVAGLERLARRPARPAPDISARLLPLPGHGRRLLRARNWLELELADDALAATWHGEGVAPIQLSLGAQDG
jgi:hypothetical protein